jgi:hypothetical protein
MRRARRSLAMALALLCSACTIGRDYIGNALRSDPRVVLHPGVTTIAQTLEMFGAPEKIQRRHDGDVLIYRFVRQNRSQLQVTTPGIGVVPSYTFFTYTKHQLKADRLTLFFDDGGTLTAFGYTGGTDELDLL